MPATCTKIFSHAIALVSIVGSGSAVGYAVMAGAYFTSALAGHAELPMAAAYTVAGHPGGTR